MSIVGLSLIFGVLGCSSSGGDSGWWDSGGPDGQPPTEEVPTTTDATTLFNGTEAVVIEVDYVANAEPAVSGALTDSTWDLFETNANRLLIGAVSVRVPKTLDDMSQIDGVQSGPYSAQDVLDISAAHRDQLPAEGKATFHILYLDGYADDGNGAANQGVVGFSVTGTHVIAIFKPVIDGLGGLEVTRNFAEQTTLIHEFGHAVGLVNNGVPNTSPHHDESHGAHCTSNACVMYYALEGTSDLVDFVSTYVSSGDTVLFDDDCLADVDAMRQP